MANGSRKIVSRAFFAVRLGKSIKPSLVEPVIEDIFASVQRNPHGFNGLMRCKRENDFAFRHVFAVSALMISRARQMKLSPDRIRDAGMAGLLVAGGGFSADVLEAGLQHHEMLDGSGSPWPARLRDRPAIAHGGDLRCL